MPFVLWFNFLAGFAYVIVGFGLWAMQRWALWLSFAIAAATLLIFSALGLQIWSGGSYEMRTVAAMGLRAMTWLVISAVAYLKLANHHIKQYGKMSSPNFREKRRESKRVK